jgi:hypothetical protein
MAKDGRRARLKTIPTNTNTDLIKRDQLERHPTCPPPMLGTPSKWE